MKKACPCLVGLAALALTLTVVAAPPEPTPPAAEKPVEKPPARDPNSPYAHSAVGAVLDANGGTLPANGTELSRALAKLGDFVQLPVPFSAVAPNSGLTHPRVVLTLRPSTTPQPKSVFVPNNQAPKKPSFGGWGGGPSGTTKLIPQPPEPLNKVAADRTQLQGRLFFAINTEIDHGQIQVRNVEFISWNTRRLAFDFGVIEGLGTDAAELKMLDGTRCVTCHKNKGPILGVAPWSNTAHHSLVQKTAADALAHAKHGKTVEGMSLSEANGPEVDAAVRFGGELLRDRAIFKQLVDSDDGRKALVLLFDAILARGSLEKHDKEVQQSVNALPIGRFVRNATQVKLHTPTSELRDFSPAGPLNREVIGVSAGEVKNQVAKHDFLRARGLGRLPSEFLPSNPKAFVAHTGPVAQHPSEVVTAVMLAQTIGLSEKDREFLADALDETVKKLNNPALTRATVADTIFNGPAFADVMRTGNLPDRDDFKDRFVAGIVDLLRAQKKGDEFWSARDTYTSAPRFDPNAKVEREVAVLPSHACASCHDFRTGAKPKAFSPIPALAFDPLDATARDAWSKTAPAKQKQEVLAALLKRIDKDKDMPPVDSVETALYRTKDPTALNAAKEWIERELKKLK